MARSKSFWLAIGELKTNRRLQYGLMFILVLALAHGGLAWRDRLGRQAATLNGLQLEIKTLKQRSRDEAVLRETLEELARIGAQVEARLWTVQSAAVGQARFSDWLNDCLPRAGITDATLKFSIPRAAAATIDPPQNHKGVDKYSESMGADNIREVRATMVFRFTPERLERLLAELEGGELLISVDTLVVNRQERRVEIGIRLPMRIGVLSDTPTVGEMVR